MPYAPETRPFYDADSHIMELPDFITSYADPKIRGELPPVSYSSSIVTDEEVAVIVGQGNRHSDEHREAQIALGDDLIAKSKEIQALGAFDSTDRIKALDLLGFKKQLVFSTHSPKYPFRAKDDIAPHLRYGAARGHNRHILEFCAADSRLMPVVIVPLDDPALAIAELEWCLEQGAEAVWVPHRAPFGHSPGHVDLEGFWARLAEADVPAVLHVGGAPLQVAKDWGNTGRGKVSDWVGGGENVRTKDATVLHHPVELFLSVMIMDGVFHRHPGLKCAAVELMAGWVPAMMRRLDNIARAFSRHDESIRFERSPSQQIIEQMAFTPMPNEDVANLIAQSHEGLYLFSSDYPHLEGTSDPIGRFERTVGDLSEATKTAFYSENFLRLWPRARVA